MIRVLLIDDHPIVRAGIRLLLEQEQDIAVVGESDCGSGALQLVERLEPDVILLDIEMPDKSGIEVAQELHEANLPARVLAMSAYDDEQYILNLFSHGTAGYLAKEEAPELIVDAVRGVFQGEEKWLSPRLASRFASAVRQTSSTQASVHLSRCETDVMQLLSLEKSNAQIAAALDISERTVRSHLSNIYDKLNLSSRVEAVHWAKSYTSNASS